MDNRDLQLIAAFVLVAWLWGCLVMDRYLTPMDVKERKYMENPIANTIGITLFAIGVIIFGYIFYAQI